MFQSLLWTIIRLLYKSYTIVAESYKRIYILYDYVRDWNIELNRNKFSVVLDWKFEYVDINIGKHSNVTATNYIKLFLFIVKIRF